MPSEPISKPCTRCGVDKLFSEFGRDKGTKSGLKGSCKECVATGKKAYHASDKGKAATAAYNRKYAQEHTEELRDKRRTRDQSLGSQARAVKNQAIREYRREMAAAINARRKARYAVNPTARKKNVERALRWYEKNKEFVSGKGRTYYAENRERVRPRIYAYQKAHPQKTKLLARICANRRRARMLNAGGDYTRQDIERLLGLQKCKCANCRTSLKRGYHIDHKVPVAKGGSNHPSNIELLCKPCNLAKAAKLPHEFAQEQGRLL